MEIADTGTRCVAVGFNAPMSERSLVETMTREQSTRPERFSYLAARALDIAANGWRDLTDLLPSLLTRYAYVDNKRDYGSCVLLAGSGRSGTTWLANVINFDNSYRFMFEPFYHARVRECRAFGEQQYLRPDDDDATYLGPAERIFTGRIRNRWVDSHNRRLRADRRLVKDVRANLLLGWIRAHFPEMHIILVLRHPCAVANSRRISRWTCDLEGSFFSQPALVEDYLGRFHLALHTTKSDFERFVLSWCIETYVPLMQFTPGEILVTTYEDCVVTPQTEIKRIFDFLQRPFCDDILGVLKKPSSQARYNIRSRTASAIISGESIVDSWMRSVSRDDIERAMAIVRLFGLDAIYGPEPMPNRCALERFMSVDRSITTDIPTHEAKR